jgi:hypothetical protein
MSGERHCLHPTTCAAMLRSIHALGSVGNEVNCSLDGMVERLVVSLVEEKIVIHASVEIRMRALSRVPRLAWRSTLVPTSTEVGRQ